MAKRQKKVQVSIGINEFSCVTLFNHAAYEYKLNSDLSLNDYISVFLSLKNEKEERIKNLKVEMNLEEHHQVVKSFYKTQNNLIYNDKRRQELKKEKYYTEKIYNYLKDFSDLKEEVVQEGYALTLYLNKKGTGMKEIYKEYQEELKDISSEFEKYTVPEKVVNSENVIKDFEQKVSEIEKEQFSILKEKLKTFFEENPLYKESEKTEEAEQVPVEIIQTKSDRVSTPNLLNYFIKKSWNE